MSALSAVVLGLSLVAVDFRTEALDLLPDPIGWLLVALGARRLMVNRAAIVAAVAAALSLSDVYLSFRYLFLDPVTLALLEACPPLVAVCPEQLRYDLVGAPRAAVIAATNVVGTIAVVLLAQRLTRIEGATSTVAAVRRNAKLAMVATPLAWAAPFVAVVAVDTVADGRYQPFWDGGLAFVSPVLMAVLLAVAACFAGASHALGRTLEPKHNWFSYRRHR